MKQIEVHSQAELNAIPNDYDGQIIVKFGTASAPAIINRRWEWPVVLQGSSRAVLQGSSRAVLRGSSRAVLWGSSSAALQGSSSAVLWDSSSAVLRGSSRAELWGNSQALDCTNTHEIKVKGNARVVYLPWNGAEYADYYALDVSEDGATARLYKAVHKRGGRYWADWTNFEYIIGSEAVASDLNTDPAEDCGQGIHMSYLDWALRYGENWPDLAVLELETNVDGLIVPADGSGKVRAAKAKVVREVPLEECGVLGKILMRRRAND